MKAYVPTREEIQAMCLEIQAEWSEKERRKRIVCDHTRQALRWRPPRAAVSRDEECLVCSGGVLKRRTCKKPAVCADVLSEMRKTDSTLLDIGVVPSVPFRSLGTTLPMPTKSVSQRLVREQ